MKTKACFGTIVLALLIGCGGSADDESENAALIREADSICITGAQRDVRIQMGLTDSRPQSTAAFLNGLAGSRRQVANEIAQLEAPDEVSDQIGALVDARLEAARMIEQGAEAAGSGNLDAYQRVRAESRTINDEGDRLAERIGLEACARVLPESEVDEISAIFKASVDPARSDQFCREMASQRFLMGRFESLTDCIAQQDQETSTDIEITDLSGTSEVFATAFVDLSSEGQGEPAEFEAGLVYLGERWQLDSLTPLAGSTAGD